MFRAARGCCCGTVFLVMLIVGAVYWNSTHVRGPASSDSASAQQAYADSYHKALATYTKRIEEIESDPRYKEAVTAAQKHAAHIREMKQVVEAQDQCERTLRSIHAPASMAEFQTAMLNYWQDLSERYSKFAAQEKRHDVPDIKDEMKRLDKDAATTKESVDSAIQKIPHIDEAEKEVQSLWTQFKRQMDENAPPEK